LAKALRERGRRQSIAASAGSTLESRAAAEGFPVLEATPGSLRRAVKNGGFQIVHAHNAKGQNLAWLATLGLNVVRVASRLVAFPPRSPLIHKWKYTFTCHGVIAASEAVAAVLRSCGVPAERIAVVEAGVDVPDRPPEPDRERFGVSGEHFVIGHAGAFTREKGQDVLLEAFLRVVARAPHARLLLAGEGPEAHAPSLRRLLDATEGKALLLGHVSDLYAFCAALDLFVMPSRSEGWGLAALSAMASGVPVVASRTGGLERIVAEGETGWLVPPDDPQALAAAIWEAMSRPDRLRRMAQNARQRALLFTPARAAEQTEAFYQRLLSASGHSIIED
jgi:glycosyltransferase involved in cell wall biosynthesis